MTPCCLFPSLRPHGSSRGRKQYLCDNCQSIITHGATRARRYPYGTETPDHRGRVRVTLTTTHPYANSGGWQYRYRLRVMQALGRRLLPTECVDHVDRDFTNDDLRNLRVVIHRDHAFIHMGRGGYEVIAQYVDGEGFTELHSGTGNDDDAVPF